ncbi:MAG: HAD hydrolase-like protein [Coprobacillus sp.]
MDLSKQEFYSHLSNMYDMYKDLPLSKQVDTGPLNAKIERELFQYLKFKDIKVKEGFDELLEWFIQKEIKIAIMSTHRTKDAVEYLQMARIYNKVDYVIGSDTMSLPLPSTQMLSNINDFFQVKNEEVLVLSSFMALNEAANKLHMNIIYCQDLVKAGKYEQKTSYKTVSNLFEVLNTLLFDRYNEVEMYAPLLGMNNHMDKQELDSVRDKLLDSYENDPQLINIVDQTYQYHVSQLNQEIPKPTPKPRVQEKPRFFFNDDTTYQKEELEIEQTKPEVQEVSISEETHDIHTAPLHKNDEDTLISLLSQINKQKPQETITPVVTDFEEIKDIVIASHQDDEEEQTPSLFMTCIVNILYTLAVSLLILFAGLIVYIAFIHQFQTGNGIFGIISGIFNVYYSFIEYIFRFILDGLNSFISFIPSYPNYLNANAIFSSEGVKLFNIFIFHFFIISFVKIIIYVLRRGSKDEIDF